MVEALPLADVPIANGTYVSKLRAKPLAFHDVSDTNRVDLVRFGKGDFTEVRVAFSAPPDAGIALSIYRFTRFAASPSIGTTKESLIQKYGPLGFQKSYGDRGHQQDFVWAWDASGKPVSLTESHVCVLPVSAGTTEDARATDTNALAALHAGCAVVVHATLYVENDESMQVMAADQSRIHATSTKTADFATRAVAEVEQKERDKAASVPAPKL